MIFYKKLKKKYDDNNLNIIKNNDLNQYQIIKVFIFICRKNN